MRGSRCRNALITLITAFTLSVGLTTDAGVGAASSAQELTAQDVSKIVINIPSRTLWVYSGDEIVKYFPVGVGRPGFMTPVGQFSVLRKILEPGWENPYKSAGAVRIAPGGGNPLGTRWIGFYRKGGGEYGIHGTDNPSSVGRFSSHGCVRMKVPDAEELFELVNVGTPVEVVYEPVLIRRKGDDIRLVVFQDRFGKGMPTPEEVMADIVAQYPNVSVDINQVRQALGHPTERPVVVAQVQEPVHPALPLATGQSAQPEILDPLPATDAFKTGLQPVEAVQSR